MAYQIKQSSTECVLLFFLVQTADHLTALTGASPTVTISKNGGTFGSPSGAVTEIANGWYKVAANATDTGTLGPIALHATAASGDPFDGVVAEVVAYDPQDSVRLGLTAMPNAAAGASGGLPLSVDTSGRVDVLKVNGTSQTAKDLGAGVNVSSINSVAATSVTAVNANIGETQPLNFTGTGASALVKVDVTDIATAAVNTASAQLGVNVVTQANIDFGALQKTSLNAATPTVTAGTITAGAINNAAFNADVASTAYASNTLAQMIYKFFDNAFTGYADGSTFTANGLLDRLAKAMWIIRNQITIVDATGAGTILKDDSLTTALTVSLTDNAVNTLRTRAA